MEKRNHIDESIGALWVKSGRKGPYMTGTINGVQVVCFPVTSDNPKAPAWRVLKSKPKDQVSSDATGHVEETIKDIAW